MYLRAAQPFSSNVKCNTDSYIVIASVMRESIISSGSFWLMATLTLNHPFTSVIGYSRQKSSESRYLSQAKVA